MNEIQGDLFTQPEVVDEIIRRAKEINRFFNTTNLTGKDLKHHEFRTGTQNYKVLQCFRERPGMELTPFEVRIMTHQIYAPITSIRRAMTTLTGMGYLVKTGTRKIGEYNEYNYCWRLNLDLVENKR